jgi:hypothetical protein
MYLRAIDPLTLEGIKELGERGADTLMCLRDLLLLDPLCGAAGDSGHMGTKIKLWTL